MSAKPETSPSVIQNTVAGVVGNVLEWYDFAVFGYFAPIIGAQFFPSDDKLASLINAFGVFAAGYLMRPLGGMIFGHLGDRLGRKQALKLSVMMMAIPTTLLGFLPTHAQIGLAAPILLVLLRLIQGVSVGGELIGSISFVTEIAPPNRRGLLGSLSFCSATGGILVGSAVATLVHGFLDEATIKAWAWRLPFMAGFLIGGFGLWMRQGMIETPEFEKLKQTEGVDKSPVLEAIKTHPGRILHLAAMVALLGGGFYMLFVWWPTYLTQIVKPAVPHALAVNTISMIVLIGLVPLAGWLSDLVGRKPLLVVGGLAMALAAYPLYYLTDHGVVASALGAQLVFALIISLSFGPMAATMVDMFPTRIRFSAVAIGYNVTLAVIGGTAPLVCTWLVKISGDIAAPAYYLIALSLTSFIAATRLKLKRKR